MPRKAKKPRGAHNPHPVRWTAEEWAEIEAAVKQARVSPTDIIRRGTLNLCRILKKTNAMPIEPPPSNP